jgi:hypothetical protein
MALNFVKSTFNKNLKNRDFYEELYQLISLSTRECFFVRELGLLLKIPVEHVISGVAWNQLWNRLDSIE